MLLLAMSLVVSLGLLALFHGLAHGSNGRAWIGGISALTCLGCCFAFSTQLMLQGLLTFAATMLLACIAADSRWTQRAATTAWLASWILVLAGVWSRFSAMSELRAQFPLESLAERLAYEQRPEIQQRLVHDGGPPPAGAMAYDWQGNDSNPRGRSLEQLHSHYYDDFVIASGFGPVRMAGVGSAYVELPDVPPLDLPQPPDDATPDPGSPPPPDDPVRPPAGETLAGLHSDGLNAFLDGKRMGYVQSANRVAGFASHRFVKLPASHVAGGMQSWRITRLELIGTLRHPAPVVYVSEALPNLEDIEHLPARDLNPFEQHALPQLHERNTVVQEESPGHLRMLGAVRAARQCTVCHAVPEGTLLGAFSYELHHDVRPATSIANDDLK